MRLHIHARCKERMNIFALRHKLRRRSIAPESISTKDRHQLCPSVDPACPLRTCVCGLNPGNCDFAAPIFEDSD